jgi:nucleoside 2-deoxyribosyltransferase
MGNKSNKSNFDNMTLGELTVTLNSMRKSLQKQKKADKKRIYFAAPWFTDKAKVLYDYCREVDAFADELNRYSIFYPMCMEVCSPEKAFEGDVAEILACDALIALVDDKDIGTAWEIGMAFALGKPIYLVGFDESTFEKRTNLMLAFSGKCFTVDKLYKFLTCGLGHDEFVNIEKKWEVLE